MEPDQPQSGSAGEPESQTRGAAAGVQGRGGRRGWRAVGVLLAALALAGLAGAAYAVVMARASGSGTSLPLAAVSGLPTLPPVSSSSPAPHHQTWMVARVRSTLRVLADPTPGARVIATVPPRDPRYGGETVMLVRGTTNVSGQEWYDVLLPAPAAGVTHGWVRSTSVGVYVVSTRIVIDLSARTLSVIRDGKVIAQFPVAVGSPQLPTPTGNYFVTEKVRALDPSGVYGPLAFALSAYKPQLASEFPPLGELAIHGWYDPSVIGKAVSHGCIRMKNADILTLSSLVLAGSPVQIRP